MQNLWGNVQLGIRAGVYIGLTSVVLNQGQALLSDSIRKATSQNENVIYVLDSIGSEPSIFKSFLRGYFAGMLGTTIFAGLLNVRSAIQWPVLNGGFGSF